MYPALERETFLSNNYVCHNIINALYSCILLQDSIGLLIYAISSIEWTPSILFSSTNSSS